MSSVISSFLIIIIKLCPLFPLFPHPPANSTWRPSSLPSPQKTPRPLLAKTNDGLLPRRLLSRGARRWWKPCRCRYVSILPCRPNHGSPSQPPRLTLSCLPGILTKEFLDFSASRGNNLRSIGLEPGCKWCLSVIFSDPSFPFSSCFEGSETFSPPETCPVTLEPSLKEAY